MKNLLIALFAVFVIAACESTTNDDRRQVGFVTLLGNDTLAVEQFEMSDSSITAQVILRTPQTTFSSFELLLDEAGGIREMTRTDFSLESGFESEGEVIQTIHRQGDSLWVETQTDEGLQSHSAPYEEGVLPFIDMVHWPFEVAFVHAADVDADTINQSMLTWNNISNFVIAQIEDDSMTVRHPFRGVMGVDVADNGGIELLDAGLTTRKLKVYRTSGLDMNAIGQRFAASDQQGNSFGELSGAETSEFSFHNTNFRVDYGSPQKRGRELFGGIVPWGERWRTGANRATHFYISNDLQFGDLEVPAGEYTLYTIPEQDGGALIINTQTGQNGTSYDQSMDLGRIPMEISTQNESTEAFTITVEESGDGGVLKLIWGNTVFSSPFEIQ
ncbi:DUF2911 domain-containing protein [Rhodohalobacter sp. 614A]|uniref:DUF2911 domain-containing protein n=1 Tax=Rhodohalobacter sp. 614A TaxID=2908649 RepID=UPI001F2AFE58|nr:DUF2911 domain-containing protein [Rhodohalobacter sp. 614A]